MRKQTLFFISAISILGTSCSPQVKSDTPEKVAAIPFCLQGQLKNTTAITAIEEQPIQDQLTVTGKVEYNENDLVAYRSLLQGVVTKVNFELGDYVTQGKVLAVIKSAEIQGMAQEKRIYENQVELLQKQIKLKKELLHDGLTAQPEVTELESQLQSVQIEIDKVNSTLQIYRAVGDGLFQIIAPKNGYVVQKDISLGQSITADAANTLFSISNLNQVWVMVNIYANNLKYVHTGDMVKVKTVAYPDRIYHGKIDKIYNVFDANEHVTKARVVLENQDLNLMPGLSADIIINKKNTIATAFAIPKKAVVFNNNKQYVVVYTDDCHMEVRKVSPITSNEEYIYVNEKFGANAKVVSSNTLIILEELNK